MADYLVESALLSQGLKRIKSQEIQEAWPSRCGQIAWLKEGRIMTAMVDEFCQIREKGLLGRRINGENFRQAMEEGWTGALTASGTMMACELLGISLAVSGGIGGLNQKKGWDNCHDLEALQRGRTALAATAPKDMFDLSETIRGVKEAGVTVLGRGRDVCDGYLFQSAPVKLSGRWEGQKAAGGYLFLQEIPAKKRISEESWLWQACRYGDQVRAAGGEYHPAVNERLEYFSQGESARIQLAALTANLAWAEELT